jgi:hypothetical protein
MSTDWVNNLGGGGGSTDLDSFPSLADGVSSDNIWTAQRANALANSIIAIEKILRGDASGKDISGVGTAKINADKLDGNHAAAFILVGGTINASQLNSHDASYYWSDPVKTENILIAPGTNGIGLCVNAAAGTYSEVCTFSNTYSRFVCISMANIWVVEGAGGKSAGNSFGDNDGAFSFTGGTVGPPWTAVPYTPTTGGLVMGSVKLMPTAVRVSAISYGTGANLHRVMFRVHVSGL